MRREGIFSSYQYDPEPGRFLGVWAATIKLTHYRIWTPIDISEIPRHVLRVSCRRCERTVEIQTVDAVRLYGGKAIWKDVAQRLLDDTCQQRTGRHEEDGCWPAFETP
jgi:hypothetical protein